MTRRVLGKLSTKKVFTVFWAPNAVNGEIVRNLALVEANFEAPKCLKTVFYETSIKSGLD